MNLNKTSQDYNEQINNLIKKIGYEIVDNAQRKQSII